MKLLKKLIPLLFLFNLGYAQEWKIGEEQILIKHKGIEYNSKIAKRGNSIAYYVYKLDENGEEEIIGDDAEETQDYKDLALTSYYNFNKKRILSRAMRDLEMLKDYNKTYKIGITLNKAVEELSEILSTELLNVGNKEFSLTKEIYKKYSQELKKFNKNFMNDVIKDLDKIKSLDDLIEKLEEKIFNSTVIEAKENIERLENAKRILSAGHVLSTGEVKLAEKMVSDGTINGYAISSFQNEYIRNINEIGYQLTNVGSSMLKNFPAGKKAYELVKKLGINGIEEIDSEALRRSFKKMKKVHERVSLSMNLYKENLDPGIEGSNSNLLIKELLKKLDESLSNLEFITGNGAVSIYAEPRPIGYYSVDAVKDSNSVTFDMNSDRGMLAYGWADLELNLKKLNKNLEIKIDAGRAGFNQNLFYHIGITDGRAISMSPEIRSFAQYELIDENKSSGTINWTIRLYKGGRLNIIRNGESFEDYKNNYIFDIKGLNKWILRVVAYTRSFEEAHAIIKFDNIKVKRY